MEALFRRADRLPAVLDALERGEIVAADLEPQRRRALLDAADQAVRARAARLLPAGPATDKQKLVAAYRRRLTTLSGDVGRGEAVFTKACASCHRPERGPAVGPNLATLEDRTPDKLLADILDPNRDVRPIFITYVVRTKDGQDLTGVIADETAGGLTLRQAAGIEETVLRRNVESLRSTGASLMPEGLETGIDPQQMADLLLYLRQLKN
jgi:putative heme-binding domain-containing protein